MSSSSTEAQLYFSTQVEIFISLKDIQNSLSLSSNGELKCTPNVRHQQITVFWKPPGASHWIEKFKSEVIHGKSNLQFIASMTIDFETKDASSINFRIEIRQLLTRKCSTPDPERKDDMSLWGTAHFSLDKILSGGHKGFEMPIALDWEANVAKYSVKHMNKVLYPGTIFLRGEIILPSVFGVLVQFGIQSDKPASDYYIELHKLNQANAFELSFPYTLIYRSELDDILPNYPTQINRKPIFFLESRLSNGDFDRVLKVDIFKKETFERKGFALTTLGTLLRDQSQVLNVDRVDSFYPYKKKEMKVIVTLCGKLPVYPMDHYLRQGWKIVPVTAVDFSRSNWNEELHKRSLHENQKGRSPYEEGLEIGSDAMSTLVDEQHWIFFGFGSPKLFMNAYRPGTQHIHYTLRNYHDALCTSLLSSLTISHERSPMMDGGGTSSQSSTSTASTSTSPLVYVGGSLLAPLFGDLVTLINARKDSMEYFTVIILTDGQFTDSARYYGLLNQLSVLPVSLIFVGVGLGDFRQLLDLEKAWEVPLNGMFLSRKFVHVIHFRCRTHWDASLVQEKFRSNPYEIFAKEILTAVREQALDFFRRYFKETDSSK